MPEFTSLQIRAPCLLRHLSPVHTCITAPTSRYTGPEKAPKWPVLNSGQGANHRQRSTRFQTLALWRPQKGRPRSGQGARPTEVNGARPLGRKPRARYELRLANMLARLFPLGSAVASQLVPPSSLNGRQAAVRISPGFWLVRACYFALSVLQKGWAPQSSLGSGLSTRWRTNPRTGVSACSPASRPKGILRVRPKCTVLNAGSLHPTCPYDRGPERLVVQFTATPRDTL